MQTTRKLDHVEPASIFVYDECSPSKLSKISGKHVGSLHKYQNYWNVSLNGKRYQVHRIIWMLHYGEIPEGMLVDHVNRDRTDNRIENLRLVTSRLNSRNMNMYENNTSGVTGVHLKHHPRGDFWVAEWIGVDNKRKSRSYSVVKYGFQAAFDLACSKRFYEIENANKQGAGYSGYHGK